MDIFKDDKSDHRTSIAYTCKCGNKTWGIFGETIKCFECGEEYRFEPVGWRYNDFYLPSARLFNSNREKLLIKENSQKASQYSAYGFTAK